MPHTSAIAYFDGACLPKNPGGTATYGWVLYANENGEPGELISQDHGIACRGPEASNNRGEYGGVTAAMMAALKLGIRNLVVRGDSQLIIYQLQGRFAVKSPNLLEAYAIAKDLARQFQRVTFEWIPREQNSNADRLSEIAYEELTGRPVPQGKPTYKPTAGRSKSNHSSGSDKAGTNSGSAAQPPAGSWRDQPATDKQFHFLRQLGQTPDASLTKGQASDLIDRLSKQKK